MTSLLLAIILLFSSYFMPVLRPLVALKLFLTEWSRSYIVLALGSFSNHFKVLHITEV